MYYGSLATEVAPEQARLCLPAYALYANWYWTANLTAVKFFLEQRLSDEAQFETSHYAQAVDQIVATVFNCETIDKSQEYIRPS
ncbi:MAG: hypothetical protein COY37_02095 [Candidatus Aquicultor secundus]|uniref:Thymidylate synthase (FAD) n=1 Tax=Candidatus Aquicultor secundus TaxID=1973895 RepID=A0A2M7T9U3_9ACTN|nr:MAG: hypothetical protein COT10_04675 [Candidatus Aquicultor secundus]PIX51413.1 MAG: hypothetical protein COZ51_09780 [Candidatus Aquicultor secundus]PIZ41586.1 MAG: hypothetical protein COY37_02095 [Candidatus Aquicultor secundus]